MLHKIQYSPLKNKINARRAFPVPEVEAPQHKKTREGAAVPLALLPLMIRIAGIARLGADAFARSRK